MKNGYHYKVKKYQTRSGYIDTRDPQRLNFDNLDLVHEFSSIRVINQYRKIGEEIMRRING